MKFEKVQISKGILYIAKAKLREVLLKKKSLKCWLFVHISNLTAYKANYEIEKKIVLRFHFLQRPLELFCVFCPSVFRIYYIRYNEVCVHYVV